MAYTFGGAMRTNIVLDEKLVQEAFAVSEYRTKKDLIHEALRVFIRLKKRKDLSELAGKIAFSGDFDHKTLRKLRG
jgi:Arc/MetJ family transcription regulator